MDGLLLRFGFGSSPISSPCGRSTLSTMVSVSWTIATLLLSASTAFGTFSLDSNSNVRLFILITHGVLTRLSFSLSHSKYRRLFVKPIHWSSLKVGVRIRLGQLTRTMLLNTRLTCPFTVRYSSVWPKYTPSNYHSARYRRPLPLSIFGRFFRHRGFTR